MTGMRAAPPPPTGRQLSTVRLAHPGVVAYAFTGVLLLVLLGVIVLTDSMVGAIAAVSAAVLLLALIALGLTRTSEVIVGAGFVVVPMNDLHPDGALSFVTAADAAFGIGFLLMIPGLLGRPLRLPPIFVLGAGGLFSVALLSSLLSADPVTSLNFTVRLFVGVFGLAVLMLWWHPDRRKIILLAWAYVLGNVINVVYGLFDGLTTGSGRYVGLTEHPNILGYTSLFALTLAPFLLAHTPRSHRWLPLLTGAVNAYGIWISGSRAAFATFLAVALVFPVLKRSILAGLGLMGGLAGVLFFLDRLLSETSTGNPLGRLLGAGSASGSDEQRERAASYAIDVFLHNPLVGQGFSSDPLDAHIIYLQIAAALGLFGVVFHLLVLWTTVRPVLTVPEPANLLALPALAYIIAGCVSPILWDRYIWVPLSLALLAPTFMSSPEDAETSAETTQGVATRGSP